MRGEVLTHNNITYCYILLAQFPFSYDGLNTQGIPPYYLDELSVPYTASYYLFYKRLFTDSLHSLEEEE